MPNSEITNSNFVSYFKLFMDISSRFLMLLRHKMKIYL